MGAVSISDQPVIFISYRRSDSAGHARALHEYLSGRFDEERIFFDRSAIESGHIFPETLRQGVERCAVLLALIGPQWLDVSDAEGRQRLDDPDHFVRQEIALALEHGKTVIPILFDDTPIPLDGQLPQPLKPLAARDVLTLRGKTYEYNTQRRELVRLLAKVSGVPEPFADVGEPIVGVAPEHLPAIIEAATREIHQLTGEQQQTIRSLEKQLGANEAQLRAFFHFIGEAGVPPEQQLTRLVEIAIEVRELKAQATPDPTDEPEVIRLKDQVREALETGRLEQADELLSEIEAVQDDLLEQQQRQIEHQQLDRAATTARRGGVALTRLRYGDAAKHFAAAAKRVPLGYEEQVLEYLDQEADALYRQGQEFGDNDALADAIERFQALLDLRARERVPLHWAMTQNNLGNALWTLGQRESGTERLGEAVDAYRAALEERTRERVPLDWATTQNNLGNALSTLGERELDVLKLKEARSSIDAAFEVFVAAGQEHHRAYFENRLRDLDEKIAAMAKDPSPG